MSDVTKLVQATFPGPVIKCLSSGENEQTVITCGIRHADGEIVNEEPWGVLSTGESIQILDPMPGEVWTIESENLENC